MQFEWDEGKRQLLLRERRVDLLKAARIFEGWVVTNTDVRKDYGEVRKKSVGMVGENCFVVVWTVRNDCIRLITAWKGGQSEKGEYQAGFARRN